MLCPEISAVGLLAWDTQWKQPLLFSNEFIFDTETDPPFKIIQH